MTLKQEWAEARTKVIDNGEAGDIELLAFYDIVQERAAANRLHILGIVTDILKSLQNRIKINEFPNTILYPP